jgi:uncharacterized protein
MEPHTQGTPPEESPRISPEPATPASPPAPSSQPHDFSWFLVGDDGLRSGWSALFFVALYYLLSFVFDVVALSLDPHLTENIFSPAQMLITEVIPVAAIFVGGALMARIESRRLVDYHFVDSRGPRHFLMGLMSGFAALSALVALLALGGWLRFEPPALHGGAVFQYGAVWGVVFLLVALFEEGSFRCYLLSTLGRGINFWWALATVATLCLLLVASSDPKGSGGVFLIASLGILPCWFIHRTRATDSSFWQATWATSTAFGFFHTSNNGENAIGIFAAALIGAVFCVSVRVTGSAWWAIGCHAAWDWAETYFYGTPDSGLVPERHLLSTMPIGSTLWSGGADGPEGSLLVVPVVLLLLALLFVFFRRGESKPVVSQTRRTGDNTARTQAAP